MIEVYRKILDTGERRQFWLLTALMVLVALVEVVGLSALLVLLNVLADPASIAQSRALTGFQDALGYDSLFAFCRRLII